MIRSFINTELKYLKQLSGSSRALIYTFVFYNIADPLFGIFLSAYLWRRFENPIPLGVYALLFWFGLTLAFLLNGFLLSRISARILYGIGLSAQGLVILALFSVGKLDSAMLVAFGFGQGLAAGVYWANRNFITLAILESAERDYFCNLEIALQIFLSVTIPFVLGVLLEYGGGFLGLEVWGRYQIFIVLANIAVIFGSFVVFKAELKPPKQTRIFFPNSSTTWNLGRLLTLLQGVAEGSSFILPATITFHLVGKEGAFGLIQSSCALVTSVFLYSVARKSSRNLRKVLITVGPALFLVGALVFAFNPTSLGAVVYLVLSTSALSLIWGAVNPLMLDLVELNQGENNLEFAHVIDREIFLNVGRGLGALALIYLFVALPLMTVVILYPVLLGLLQCLFLPLFQKIDLMLKENLQS